MKKSIIAILAVSAISTLGSSAAFAHEDYSERGTLHWLEHVQERVSSPSERELATYGYASNAAPSRTVTVNADTSYVNVTGSMPFCVEIDSSADMTVAPIIPGDRRDQRILGQVLQPGHAQVGDGDEVAYVAESARSALGLLQHVTAGCKLIRAAD